MAAKDEQFKNWQSACEYIYDILKKAIPLSGKGIQVEQTPAGTKINILGGSSGNGGGGTTAFPCKVISGSNAAGYTVEIYANGKNEAATGTGTLEVLELLWGDNVPPGTWLIGHASSVTVTGGNES